MMDDVIDRIFKVTYWVAAALLMALFWGLIVFAVWALVCWIAS
jgi:hypothetical protein